MPPGISERCYWLHPITPRVPQVLAGDSARSLRSQRPRSSRNRQEIPLAHCVRSGMVKPAEGNRGGRWAAREKAPATALPNPPPISPFFSPLAAHHSAKRDSVERNLRAIYDLSGTIIVNYQGWRTGFCLNPSHCCNARVL